MADLDPRDKTEYLAKERFDADDLNGDLADAVQYLSNLMVKYPDKILQLETDHDEYSCYYDVYYMRKETPEEVDRRVNREKYMKEDRVKQVKMQLAVLKQQYPELF